MPSENLPVLFLFDIAPQAAARRRLSQGNAPLLFFWQLLACLLVAILPVHNLTITAFPMTIMRIKMASMSSICHLSINIHHGHFALHCTRQHLNSSEVKKCSGWVGVARVPAAVRPQATQCPLWLMQSYCGTRACWIAEAILTVICQTVGSNNPPPASPCNNQTTASVHLFTHWNK